MLRLRPWREIQLLAQQRVSSRSNNHFETTSSHPFSNKRTLTTFGFWNVVEGAESLLIGVHVYSNLPWWAVITGTTFALRATLTVPLAVYQQRVGARVEVLKPLISEYAEAIKHNVIVKCRRENQPVEEANRRIRKEVRKMTKEIYSQEKIRPLATFLLPWCQIPLWIVLSLAIRSLCGVGAVGSAVASSLSTEGALWFTDLTVPDSYCALPIFLAITNLLNIEIHSLRRADPTRFQRIFTNSFRLLSLSAGVVSTQLPTALTLYWSVSSSFSLLQNLLLMSPRIRRAVRVPSTPKESKTPYKDLLKMMDLKGRKFLERQRKDR